MNFQFNSIKKRCTVISQRGWSTIHYEKLLYRLVIFPESPEINDKFYQQPTSKYFYSFCIQSQAKIINS